MATNGRLVLVYVEISSVATLVAAQRDATFTENRPTIDASSKDNDYTELIQGRYDAEVSFTAIWDTTDAGYAAMRNALRNGTNVVVHRYVSGGSVESATGLVENFTETFPDQDTAVGDFTVKVSGEWS